MKKVLITSIATVIYSFAFGQYSGQASSNLSAGGGQGSTGQIYDLLGPISERNAKQKDLYESFQGSPYVSETFLPTTMFYGEEKLGKIYYRYNALNEEIEIKDSPEMEQIKGLARDKAIQIKVDGKDMAFKTFITLKNITMNGYLTTLLDGEEYDLFKRILVKFTEGKPAANSFVKAVPSRFSQFTEYYFQKKGVNQINEIPMKNRKLLKLLEGPTKNNLKSYLEENDLNIREEEELVRVFKFLNE